jgi:hypothetical protein
VTGVNREYHVHLDNGVRLTIFLPANRSGPAVQASFIAGDPTPYRVQLPGAIVAISAPGIGAGGISWAKVAEAFRVPLLLPEPDPDPPKPTPEPFAQCEIPL